MRDPHEGMLCDGEDQFIPNWWSTNRYNEKAYAVHDGVDHFRVKVKLADGRTKETLVRHTIKPNIGEISYDDELAVISAAVALAEELDKESK